MSANYGTFDMEVTHTCETSNVKQVAPVNSIYVNCNTQLLRDARHKSTCYKVQGEVLKCKTCGLEQSTTAVVTNAIQHRRDSLPSISHLDYPFTKKEEDKLLDIAAYRFVYDMVDEDNRALIDEDNSFWHDEQIRRILLRRRFDEHHDKHANSCFKKGCECRFLFPFMAWCNHTRLYKSGAKDDTAVDVCRNTLDGNSKKDPRFIIELERNQGCQYMNTHNIAVSDVLNCNTNVQSGDSNQTFYQTMYQTKNTQKDDCEPRDLVAKALIRRLLRAQELAREQSRASDDQEMDEEVNDWVEGLSRVLSGINAATSRSAVSAPMAHNLTLNDGSRFKFSHDFVELLLGQMEEVLEGNNVSFVCRTCFKQGSQHQWADISANDYIFRPKRFDNICFFQQTMHYRKRYGKKQNENDGKYNSNDDLMFVEGHPGHGFAYAEKHLLWKIPIVSIPRGHLCRIADLDISSHQPNEDTLLKRELYAKVALLLFSPFTNGLQDIAHKGSYWKKFNEFRRQYFSGAVNGELHIRDRLTKFELMPESDNDRDAQYISSTTVNGTFWIKGFEILQNIEDRLAVEECNSSRATDPVTDETECKDVEGNKTNIDNNDNDEYDRVKDISFFCNADEEDDTLNDDMDGPIEDELPYTYTHKKLINQSNATKNRLIPARLTSHNSLFGISEEEQTNRNSGAEEEEEEEEEEEAVGNTIPNSVNTDFVKHSTVLRLITGTLLGGRSYDTVYDLSKECDSEPSVDVDSSNSSGGNDQPTGNKTPTLQSIARLMAKEQDTKLDEKQYIMYEILATTFLLSLLLDDIDHDDGTSLSLSTHLTNAVGQLPNDSLDEVKSLIDQLKERGAREQLIMFVTGLAGAGKSTAIKVAQRFCFEFCKAASIMWSDNTFLFTAYTGSAAAAFGGLTTSSATFLNKRNITDDDRKMYEGVRVLIIDEVSFLKDSELLKLDRNLKKVGDSHKPFGGFSIVFGGDFQQIEPVGVKTKEILWNPGSSRHFENSLNCAIVLDGMHRFKDDLRYGEMLKQLCSGEMTQEDINWINTRVIGKNGLTLPDETDGDTCYACPVNKERNSVTAGIFSDHIQKTHPDADSDTLPPSHTIIIEADIKSSKSRNNTSLNIRPLRRRIVELGDDDVRCARKLIDPSLCCYNGAYFMCISNENLKTDGTGNGTQGRLVKVKLKQFPTSYRWKIWDNKKVWTVCAKDVEYVQFAHHPKSHNIMTMEQKLKVLEKVENSLLGIDTKATKQTRKTVSQVRKEIIKVKKLLKTEQQRKTFKLKPQNFQCKINVSPNDLTLEKQQMKCKLLQLPVNASDAITGHKLQGLTKDRLIVYSWNKSTNWIYVVLSRVRTLSGLYLVQSLTLKYIKPPSQDYLAFLGRMKDLQQHELDRFHSFKSERDSR